jgi:O-antigen/teichoic acid export membrane protein
VKRAAAWLVAAQVLAQAIGLATTLLLASRLGLAGFGEYALAGAVLYVANVGTSFGTDMVLVRDVAASRDTRRTAAAAIVQLGLSVAVIVILWVVAPLVGGGRVETSTALRVLSLALLPSALFGVATAALRGVGRMRSYAVVGIVAASVPLLGVLALVPHGAGVVRAALVLLVAQAIAGIAVWLACAASVRGMRVIPRASWSDARDMLRASAPVGVLGLLGMAYQRLPVITVGIALGPAATSWFTCGSRTVEASKTAHVGIFSAAYPLLARAHADGDQRAHGELRWSWLLSIGLAVSLTAVLLPAAPWLVGRLFSSAFAPSATGLRILALSVLPSTVATYRSMALLAARREATTLRILAASLAVLVAGLAALVPAFGWLGACWAVLLAETVQAALMLAGGRPRRVRVAGAVAGRLPSPEPG